MIKEDLAVVHMRAWAPSWLNFVALLSFALATAGWADPATRPAVATADDKVLASLSAYGKQMADAATNGSNSKLLDLMYPPVIDKAGGRDKLLAAMNQGQHDMQDKGISIKSSTMGKPGKIYSSGKTLYAMLPETIVLNVPKGTLKSEGCLIGISEDSGKTWSFVDGAGGEELIRGFLPDLPEDIKIPDRTQPVFTPDAK